MTHEQIEYRNYVMQGMASYGREKFNEVTDGVKQAWY